MDSILDSTKKALGVDTGNTAFDPEIILHINSVMSTINQLGVGPDNGFAIEDSAAVWADFLGDDIRLNDVKQYVFLKTRVVFDPPTGSFHLVNSMKEMITELEWRISARREETSWVDPRPTLSILEPEVVIVPISDAWISE